MSLQAICWALDESEAVGNDRLVMIIMCHHAEEGFCWASRATMTDETRLSGSTVQRCQSRLVRLGEIRECNAKNAPALYLALPPNRRPRLFELTGFLGSHFADSLHRRAAARPGVALGGRWDRAGSRATVSDLPVSEPIGNQQSDNNGAVALFNDEEPATPPPWLALGITRAEWRDRGRKTG